MVQAMAQPLDPCSVFLTVPQWDSPMDFLLDALSEQELAQSLVLRWAFCLGSGSDLKSERPWELQLDPLWGPLTDSVWDPYSVSLSDSECAPWDLQSVLWSGSVSVPRWAYSTVPRWPQWVGPSATS